MEFALVLPVMMLVLLIAVDFGRMFFTYIEVNNAAREGAAYAAGNPTDTVGITLRATQETNAQSQGGESPIIVTANCADSSGTVLTCASAPGGSGTGNTITVGVSEQFTFLTPLINGLFNNNFQVGSAATAAVLNLAAGGSGGPGTCTTMPNASFSVVASGMTVTVNASSSTPNTGQCAISGYNWDMGDGASPFPPVVGVTASYTYAAAGNYTITLQVTNQAGNSQSTQNVTVGGAPTPTPSPSPSPSPSPTATPSPTPVCAMVPTFTSSETGKSGKFHFYGSSGGQPAPVTWSWTFGDGNTATGQNVANDYSGNGPYTVTLTVTNGSCTASATQQVSP